MPIYSWKFTVPPNESKEFEVDVEGDYITYLRVRFPPGPQGLLKVAFYYGIKQIFPEEGSDPFAGDDEIIEYETLWPMPEYRMSLKVKATNEDELYPHSVYVILVTRNKNELPEFRLALNLYQFFKYMFMRRW